MGKFFSLTPEQCEKIRQAKLGTQVIWASELSDVDSVVKKIRDFNECRTSQSRASREKGLPGKCRDFIRSIPNGDKEKVQS